LFLIFFEKFRFFKLFRVFFVFPSVHFQANAVTATEPPLSIRSEKSVEHPALIRYLKQRGIKKEIADRHVKEVLVDNGVTGKSIFALGFKNEEGGNELRNPFFKGSTRPKTISFVRTDNPPANRIHLFQGFMDYLSAVTRFGQDYLDGDSIILNSAAFCPKRFRLFAITATPSHAVGWTMTKPETTRQVTSSFLKANKTYSLSA
jgi:hypothetical protein